MKLCGIICEFNPFHNGHTYLIYQAKKKTGANIICLQSGNFVQHGEPAILEKYDRATAAIASGASAVLELPTIFATAPAENFALGAIKILNGLGANYLAFGVQGVNLEILEKVANLKYENSEQFVSAFKDEMKNGINYNSALKRAIAKLLGEEILEILNQPNNVLAIEYLVAIKKLNSNIIPVAIERSDNGFAASSPRGKFLSASEIRNKIFDNIPYEEFIPKNAKFNTFFMQNHIKIFENLELLKIKQTAVKDIGLYFDYSEGIEYRCKKAAEISKNYSELLSNIVTPRYREARVKRLILYPTLGITKKIIDDAISSKPACKVLAIKKDFKEFLSKYNKKKITLILRNKDYETLSKKQKNIIEIDLNASCIFNTILETGNNDKKRGTLYL